MTLSKPLITQSPPTAADPASQSFLRYAVSGETAVLEGLLAEHLDRAYSQARRLLGNASEAEDTMQEAALELVRTARRYDGSISFAAWLSRIVHSMALNALRSRGRRQRHETRAGSTSGSTSGPEREDDGSAASSEAVRAMVRELPEGYRAAIDLHYFSGLSQRDVAASLGMNENAVKVRLHRARECLRRLLQRRGVVCSVTAIALSLTASPGFSAPPALRERVLETAAQTTVQESVRTAAIRLRRAFVAKTGPAALTSAALAGLVLLAGAICWNHFATTRPASSSSPVSEVPAASTRNRILFEDRAEVGIAAWMLNGMKAERLMAEVEGIQVPVLRLSPAISAGTGYATAKLRAVESDMAIEYSALVEEQGSANALSKTMLLVHEIDQDKSSDSSERAPQAPAFRPGFQEWHRWRLEYHDLDGKTGESHHILFRSYVDGKLLTERRTEVVYDGELGIMLADMRALYKDIRVIGIEPLRGKDIR